MYRERPSTIAHAVVWSSTVTTDEEHRVLPDGCLDLLWSGGRLVVAGPDTVAHLASWRAGTPFVGLRLSAGVGPRVLGLPAHELRDQRVPLDALWPGAEVRRLAEQLAEAAEAAEMAADGRAGPAARITGSEAAAIAEATDPGALLEAAGRLADGRPAAPGARLEARRRPGNTSPPDPGALLEAARRFADGRPADPGALLEAVAVRRLGEGAPADPVVERVAWRLGQGAAVGDVAREVGLSARQLHRRSLDAFGYGPKTLSRILRLHRALELGRSGAPAADAAYAAGYADQAHLSREARSLSGVTLTTLVA
ncbi:helix-turn-helix domain-containing protein [Jiangella alba]|nr:helix-turn-helix domain-containing protein [Jiangella alba]